MPHVGDISEHYGEQEGHPCHYLECETGGRTVADGQGTVGMRYGREVGGIVVAADTEETGYDQYDPYSHPPESLATEGGGYNHADYGIKHHGYADKEYDAYPPEVNEIPQVFVADGREMSVGTHSITLGCKQCSHEA